MDLPDRPHRQHIRRPVDRLRRNSHHPARPNRPGPPGPRPPPVTAPHASAGEAPAPHPVTTAARDTPPTRASVSTGAGGGAAGLSAGTPATISPVGGAPFTGAAGTFGDTNPGGTTGAFTAS